MELFERIRHLAEIKDISLAKIAKAIGVPQQTFHQWLKPGSQKNIWEHLPNILKLFPDVRPEWLYMGQEPIFKDNAPTDNILAQGEVERLKAENERLKSELLEAARLNRQLTTRLLVDGMTDKNLQPLSARAQGKSDSAQDMNRP